MVNWRKEIHSLYNGKYHYRAPELRPKYENLCFAISKDYLFEEVIDQCGEALILRCTCRKPRSERAIKVAKTLYMGKGDRIISRKMASSGDLEINSHRYSEDFTDCVKTQKHNELAREFDQKSRILKRDFLAEISEVELENIYRARFIRGAEIQHSLSEIDFENGKVPDVVEWGDEPFVYMIMPYIPGISIFRWCQNREYKKKLRVIRKLAAFLAEVHDLEIFHRDIKPSNILILRDEPIILDWQMAINNKDDNSKYTQMFSSQNSYCPIGFGSAEFSQPEMLLDASVCTMSADIYSFGTTMYWLLMEQEFDLDLEPSMRRDVDTVRAEQQNKYRREYLLEKCKHQDIAEIFLKCVGFEGRDTYELMIDVVRDLDKHIERIGKPAYRPLRPPAKGQNESPANIEDIKKIDWSKIPDGDILKLWVNVLYGIRDE